MQDALPILLTIEIVDYEKQGQTVYYYIEIMANGTKKWNLQKRFKDIEEMHKKLAKKLNEIPFLPAKSIFQVSGDALEKRKDDLEKYFNILASRRDVLGDADFKNFFEIDKHVRVESLTKIKMLSEIQNLPRGAKDFIYLNQKGILFVLIAETNMMSKLGTFISNFSSAKGKEEMSSVLTYQEDPPGSLEFTKLWKKSFEIEASIICVDPTTPYAAIGFTNGSITCLKIEDGFNKQQEFCKVFCHNQNITGMIVLPESGHLVSCSLDKCIIKTDVIHNEGKIAEKQHLHPLTAMHLDSQNRRFFVGDLIGSVFIYNPNLDLLHSIDFPQENLVKAFSFDHLRDILLSGSTRGLISIYNIGKPGKEKYSKLTGSFETIKNVKSIHFNADKKEVYVANTDGNVAFVNTMSTVAFHVAEAHTNSLNKMVYLPAKNLMITASGDKSVKFWRYPVDPKEKLTQKIIDQSGKILASSNPAQQYQVQKEQERKGKKDEDDEEHQNSPRAPLTLLRYQPAIEANSDDDLADPEDRKPKKSHLKEPPKAKGALFGDDEDEQPPRRKVEEKKQAEREDSPKSFLFKNSLDQAVKKPATTETQKEKPKQRFRDEDEEDEGPIEIKPKKKEPAQTVPSDYQDPLEKRLAAISQREAEAKKQQTQVVTKPKPEEKESPVEKKESPVEIPSKLSAEKEEEKIPPKAQDDDDKPLNIEELKKKSTYVPLTFQKKGGDSDDEELSGWNS